MRKLLLLLPVLISILSYGQTDTTKYTLANKDTLAAITEQVTKQVTITVPVTRFVTFPYKAIDTTTPPPVVEGKIYGFGARALGGEGKQVINVTPATFKQNVASNRILRFTQGGTISGGVTLRNISYLTIDGNGFDVIFTNSNGDGLSVASGSHHIIIQNVSAIKCSNDCFNVIESANNVAFKRVFASGGGDGGIDFASGQYVTIQESIITECWNSGASLGTGREGSWLWVAMINNKERLPFVHANYSAVGNPNAWVEGCLLWNWEGFGAAVGYKAKMVFKRNYVYSKTDPQKALSNKGSHGGEPLGYLFAEGNVSGNGLNVNTGTNMADIVLPDWAKAPITDAREAAQKILGLTFANPTAQSLLKSISLK